LILSETTEQWRNLGRNNFITGMSLATMALAALLWSLEPQVSLKTSGDHDNCR